MGWRLKRRPTLGLDGGLALAEAADLGDPQKQVNRVRDFTSID
jgi:hypothetical protein